MKQSYKKWKPKADTIDLITQCNEILGGYISAGYTITVRTLYYQLVSRNIIRNKESEYKRLTGIVNDARESGLLDWDVIEDRGRRPVVRSRWKSGGDILRAVASQYHMDMWKTQGTRVFVVVEKDALAGVLESTCHDFDVPLLAAKGYPSSSSVRDLVHDQIFPYITEGWKNRADPGQLVPLGRRQKIVFLHLGDHDPSGLDMSRDLEKRLRMFGERWFKLDFQRIALNFDQIEEHKPPPNPAKTSDSRFDTYAAKHGDESWELDALPPDVLNTLLEEKVREHIDQDAWELREEEIHDVKKRLVELAKTF